MPMQLAHRKALHRLLLAAFPDAGEFDMLLQAEIGPSLGDLAGPGTRPARYFQAIVQLDGMGLADDLIAAVFTARSDNLPLQEELADLSNAIWPEGPEVEPHQNLLTPDIAFVNRDGLRRMIAGVAETGTPRVAILRGDGLAGTSHCRYLIQHVAREKAGADMVRIDFDRMLIRTPVETMRALALLLGIASLPERKDLIGADTDPDTESAQMAASLCNWFIGKALERRNREKRGLWIVVDNAHRDTVPAPTREMIANLADLVEGGTVEGLHMFVLGAGAVWPLPLPATVRQERIAPLGRPDIEAFLGLVKERYRSLGDFAGPQAAAEAVLAGIDLAAPDRGRLETMTAGLTEIVRGLR